MPPARPAAPATVEQEAPRHVHGEGRPRKSRTAARRKDFGDEKPGRDIATLDIAATYNLAYNALALVASGLGAAVCIDGVHPAVFTRDVVFRPFRPALASDVYLAWKKGPPLTPAASALLSLLRPPS